MKYIIRPFAEIIVKSKPVRKRYLDFLQNNTNLALKRIDETLKARLFWDKLELSVPLSPALPPSQGGREQKGEIIKVLSRMPGIESFIEVEEYDLVDMEDIAEKCKSLYGEKISGKTFVVRVKRSGNHDFKSVDLERFIGGVLLKEFAPTGTKVDVHHPEITVNIEIKDKKVFLVKNIFYGIGGYPVGTQDKVLSLISGGFDSSISSFSMMKRGCKVDYLFFNLGGKAHEIGVKEVANHLWKNFSSGYKAKFISIPFEGVVSYLVQNINHRFRGIILKRLFLKVADSLANGNSFGENNLVKDCLVCPEQIIFQKPRKDPEYYAIIKGDSLGQVSSQTLKNMFVIDKASETLVLRPLVSFNKQEIVDLTKKIGTYEFACNMPEYCGVISDKPATGAKLEQVLEEEAKFPMELLEKAIKEKKIEWIDKVLEKENIGDLEVEVVSVPSEDSIVIDIREEPIEKESPLILEGVAILKIPFFDISYDFEKLDQTKTYLFYCDKGVMSKNFALSLREKGFRNIKIFRPILNDSICKVKN